MSEQSSTSWHDVSERVESLAGRLKEQLSQSADKDEVKTALHELRNAVDSAFKAAGDALKDDDVRSEVKEVGRLLGDAIGTTFARVGSEVGGLFDRRPAPPAGASDTSATTGDAGGNDTPDGSAEDANPSPS